MSHVQPDGRACADVVVEVEALVAEGMEVLGLVGETGMKYSDCRGFGGCFAVVGLKDFDLLAEDKVGLDFELGGRLKPSSLALFQAGVTCSIN